MVASMDARSRVLVRHPRGAGLAGAASSSGEPQAGADRRGAASSAVPTATATATGVAGCSGGDRGGGDGHQHRDAGGDPPVIADDEVVPEAAEGSQVTHQETATDRVAARRRTRTSPTRWPSRAAAARGVPSLRPATPATGRPARTRPGPRRPRTSRRLREQEADRELQRVLRNLRQRAVRSHAGGEHDRRAPAAAAAASGIDPALSPNVIAMKITSRPSRKTPLKATTKAYQSSRTGRRARRSGRGLLVPRRFAPRRAATSALPSGESPSAAGCTPKIGEHADHSCSDVLGNHCTTRRRRRL